MTACCHYAYGTLPGRNAPLSTTCLPLICAKNRRNRLKITTIALLKNAAKSGFFAFYSRPHQVCGLIQFPYGSPNHMLGNSVNTLFPSFSFIVKIGFVRYLSAIRILQRTFLFYVVVSCGRKLNAIRKEKALYFVCSPLIAVRSLSPPRSR